MNASRAIHDMAVSLPTTIKAGRWRYESLAKPSASAEEEEWRDQLLFRLVEVLAVGADLIAEGEARLERSARVDI